MGKSVNNENESPLQKFLDKAVGEAKRKDDLVSGGLNLGQLIEKLEKCNLEAKITIKPFSLIPGSWHSYRGYYEDLALDFTEDGKDVTVGELLKMSKECLGKVFTGYKGGDFEMDAETMIWISQYGSCSDMRIVGVDDWDESTHRYVDLLTEKDGD